MRTALEPIVIAFTKFGDHEHWRADGFWVGADDFGEWLFFPQGTVISRPDATFEAVSDHVQLVGPGLASVPSFFCTVDPPPEMSFDLYVDITTVPVWQGNTVTMVDLDLDVVRHLDGRVEVVDEDEFAEHQIKYGYPQQLVELAQHSCAQVASSVSEGLEPYATRGWSWLRRAQNLITG